MTSNNRPVVMVVEDDAEMNELQRELLDVHGFKGVAAYNGTEALDKAQSCSADAVLLDVMLPEMDGFETCKRLRNAEGNLPIIMVTALASDDCRRRGFESGADAYFSKPFDPDEIISTIHMLLNHDEDRSNGNGEHSSDSEPHTPSTF